MPTILESINQYVEGKTNIIPFPTTKGHLSHQWILAIEQSKQSRKELKTVLSAAQQELQELQTLALLPEPELLTQEHLQNLYGLHKLGLELRKEETNADNMQLFKKGLDSVAWYIAHLQKPDLNKDTLDSEVFAVTKLVLYNPEQMMESSLVQGENIQVLVALIKDIKNIATLGLHIQDLQQKITDFSSKHSTLKHAYQQKEAWKKPKKESQHASQKFKYTAVSIPNETKNISSIGYNAFITNTILSNEKTVRVLDAEFQSGGAGATADGLGELNDEAGNVQIARAAYFSAKYLTHYSNDYSDPLSLHKNLPLLIKQTGEIVREKCYGSSDAAAGVVFTHAYYYHPKKISIVAAGVGDCMAVIWRPKSQCIMPLITARQFHNGFQYNPVSITDTTLPQGAVQTNKVEIEEDDVIIRMTDGIWELLPYQADNTGAYLESTPDIIKYNALFSEFYAGFKRNNQREPDAGDYQNFLADHVKDQAKIRYNNLYGAEGIVKTLSTELGKLNSDQKVCDCLQEWKTSNPALAEKLVQYLHAAAYVTDDVNFKEFTVGELAKRLQQPIDIGDDATCSIHQVKKENCTPVKIPLSQPLELLKNCFGIS